MSIAAGLGAGLIAGGAIALLPTLLVPAPVAPGEVALQDGMRSHRRERTARAGAQVSGIATPAGAALLLLSTHRWIAATSGLAVLAVAWLLLASRVSAQYRQLERYIGIFRNSAKGLPPDVAAAIGMGQLIPGASLLPVGVDIDDALSIARERARFVRALAHPFGYRDGL